MTANATLDLSITGITCCSRAWHVTEALMIAAAEEAGYPAAAASTSDPEGLSVPCDCHPCCCE